MEDKIFRISDTNIFTLFGIRCYVIYLLQSNPFLVI